MLITNGRSDDVIDGPVKTLAESGISLFAVGKQYPLHDSFLYWLPSGLVIRSISILCISKYGGVDAACVCQRLALLPLLPPERLAQSRCPECRNNYSTLESGRLIAVISHQACLLFPSDVLTLRLSNQSAPERPE